MSEDPFLGMSIPKELVDEADFAKDQHGRNRTTLEERPIHVRVAEALGCNSYFVEESANRPTEGFHVITGWRCGCTERVHGLANVHRYDTDWAVMGPVAEKLGISTYSWDASDGVRYWGATWSGPEKTCGECGAKSTERLGSPEWSAPIEEQRCQSPLLAICNLILLLKEKGKLDA